MYYTDKTYAAARTATQRLIWKFYAEGKRGRGVRQEESKESSVLLIINIFPERTGDHWPRPNLHKRRDEMRLRLHPCRSEKGRLVRLGKNGAFQFSTDRVNVSFACL